MNTIAYFEIQADQPENCIEFYTQIFGWKFSKESMPADYWRIETESIQGGLLRRPAPAPTGPAGTNAFTNSIIVENFDTTATKIIQSGGLVALEKFAIPGRCWQGYFIDPEGNTFGIFQVDENAA